MSAPKERNHAALALRGLGDQLRQDRPSPPSDPIAKVLALMDAEVAEIEADERHHYPIAIVQVNAPLALIQLEMSTRRRTIERYAAALRAAVVAKAGQP